MLLVGFFNTHKIFTTGMAIMTTGKEWRKGRRRWEEERSRKCVVVMEEWRNLLTNWMRSPLCTDFAFLNHHNHLFFYSLCCCCSSTLWNDFPCSASTVLTHRSFMHASLFHLSSSTAPWNPYLSFFSLSSLIMLNRLSVWNTIGNIFSIHIMFTPIFSFSLSLSFSASSIIFFNRGKIGRKLARSSSRIKWGKQRWG